jgi:flagella synthesis protein FlgN
MAMFSENIQLQEIKQIFQKEIECAHLLLQSLDREYEALAKHHADTLSDAVTDKQEKIQQLELISRQREKLLASFDAVNIEKNSNQNKHYQFNGNKQLQDLWNVLVDVAEKCRDKNRINGSIVEVVSKQSRHALDILQGILPDTSSISEVYDQAGQTTKSTNKRSLVQV